MRINLNKSKSTPQLVNSGNSNPSPQPPVLNLPIQPPVLQPMPDNYVAVITAAYISACFTEKHFPGSFQNIIEEFYKLNNIPSLNYPRPSNDLINIVSGTGPSLVSVSSSAQTSNSASSPTQMNFQFQSNSSDQSNNFTNPTNLPNLTVSRSDQSINKVEQSNPTDLNQICPSNLADHRSDLSKNATDQTNLTDLSNQNNQSDQLTNLSPVSDNSPVSDTQIYQQTVPNIQSNQSDQSSTPNIQPILPDPSDQHQSDQSDHNVTDQSNPTDFNQINPSTLNDHRSDLTFN